MPSNSEINYGLGPIAEKFNRLKAQAERAWAGKIGKELMTGDVDVAKVKTMFSEAKENIARGKLPEQEPAKKSTVKLSAGEKKKEYFQKKNEELFGKRMLGWNEKRSDAELVDELASQKAATKLFIGLGELPPVQKAKTEYPDLTAHYSRNIINGDSNPDRIGRDLPDKPPSWTVEGMFGEGAKNKIFAAFGADRFKNPARPADLVADANLINEVVDPFDAVGVPTAESIAYAERLLMDSIVRHPGLAVAAAPDIQKLRRGLAYAKTVYAAPAGPMRDEDNPMRTAEERAFYKNIRLYTEAGVAGNAELQRTMYRTWCVAAMGEIRTAELSNSMDTLGRSYDSKFLLISHLITKTGITPNAEVDTEIHAAWAVIQAEMNRKILATGPVEMGTKVVKGIKGKEVLNPLFRNTRLTQVGPNRAVTVADAFEVIDRTIIGTLRNDASMSIGMSSYAPPNWEKAEEVCRTAFEGLYGANVNSKYLFELAARLYQLDGRHNLMGFKDIMIWNHKILRIDGEIRGTKNAVDYIVRATGTMDPVTHLRNPARIPAIKADYFKEMLLHPVGTEPPLDRGLFMTPEDLARTPLTAAELKGMDWENGRPGQPKASMEIYYLDWMYKANSVIGREATSVLQLYAADPKKGVAAFDKLRDGNNLLQEMSGTARSRFLAILFGIFLEVEMPPFMEDPNAYDMPNPGVVRRRYHDPGKSVKWNELYWAHMDERVLRSVGKLTARSVEEQVRLYALNFSTEDRNNLLATYAADLNWDKAKYFFGKGIGAPAAFLGGAVSAGMSGKK